jgi:hypothetical protein
MAFRRSDLQEAFFVPGTQPFRVYGYGTSDPLEEVLRQGYFAAARAPGRADLREHVPARDAGQQGEPGEPRMALVMVQSDGHDSARAGASVRLVQDFGGAHGASGTLDVPAPGAAAPPAPVKRGRGRPRGSRSTRPGALTTPGGARA